MKVYFISGIGADRRVFKHVRLPQGFTVHHVDWIAPMKAEALPLYAVRLCDQINTSQPFVLVGFSLGGIMATEISKRFPPTSTIIIGSVPKSSQLPLYYKTARKMRLLTIVPAFFFKCTVSLKRLFTRESLRDKKELYKMIWQGDSRFIKWAMQAVIEWENEVVPEPLWHLHGTKDDVFPISLTRPTHVVPLGEHMLVMSHPGEVSRILKEILVGLGGSGSGLTEASGYDADRLDQANPAFF